MADAELHQELARLVGALAEHARAEVLRGEQWAVAGAVTGRGPALRAGTRGPAARGGAGPSGAAARPPSADASPARAADGAPRADAAPTARPERGVSQAALLAVREALGDCQRCGLHAERKQIVFGVGSAQAELMFVGEAPGRDEDLQGEPFVGKAGQLLTRMIEAMGLRRDEVYICNIIKCRPPNNRDPEPDEVASCEPFLRQQIEAIAPRLIVALGNFAARTLLRSELGITRLRGAFHRYQGIPLMPTFHPAYLLRNPEAKRPAWSDLQAVMAEMDRLGLPRRREGVDPV
ncbi:MAG: uracil-DNA glycosylase [Proteobacteria bacterium]|nr:uracil-DNA glycosylase [Pseudomonadota bacterium]